MEKYDVIIAGASFAGLAVASKLNGKILLIDRENIGSHQRSACGTTVKMVKDVGCSPSIIQTFDTVALHTKNREIDIPLPEQYCTINYRKFCELLAKQNKAKFLMANVKGVKNKTIVTDKGSFKSDIIVDCTGWQAVLASSLKKSYVNRKMISFGLETEIPYKDDKLRFFIAGDNCYAWIFPCKKTARFGICTYSSDTKILPNLKKFVEGYGLKLGEIHGGYFCCCLKEPVVKEIFVVGCAAGQTLPLTGEGIRRSVYFGLKCGEIIQKILDGKMSKKQGQREYVKIALKGKKHYNYLLKAQNKIQNLANWKLNVIAEIFSTRPIANILWKKYKAI